MKCPKCNSEVSPEWNVCPNCGQKATKCPNPNCGNWLTENAKFCPECGTPLSQNNVNQPKSSPSYKPNFSAQQFASAGNTNSIRTSHDPYAASGKATNMFKKESFIVNFFRGGVFAISGNLNIYDELAVFLPIGISFMNEKDRSIPIRNISGYKKGALTFFSVYLNDGVERKFTVWNKDQIIGALERRRKAIFQKEGKEAPAINIY